MSTPSRATLRVYDLLPSRVRLDMTTSSGYWQVTEDGLFQFGHSNDHRPDLAQLKVLKVLLATLDPLGMPLACDVLSGEPAMIRGVAAGDCPRAGHAGRAQPVASGFSFVSMEANFSGILVGFE